MNTEFDRHGPFARAVAFAAYAHDGAMGEGTGLPSVMCSLEAAAIAAAMTNDPDVLAAAVLQGVTDRCGVDEGELRAKFGRRVAALACAFPDAAGAGDVGNWQKQCLRTVNRLRGASREQMILVLSSHLGRLRALRRTLAARGDGAWRHVFPRNRSLQRWYHASVAGALEPLAGFEAHAEYLRLIEELFS